MMDRKAYKAKWAREARAKRAQETFVDVTLRVPRRLCTAIYEEKPYGWSLSQFIVRKLNIQFGGKEIPQKDYELRKHLQEAIFYEQRNQNKQTEEEILPSQSFSGDPTRIPNRVYEVPGSLNKDNPTLPQ